MKRSKKTREPVAQNLESAKNTDSFIKAASKNWHMKLAFSICFFCLLMAFLRIHLRVKTTMIGYEVGKLQSKEIELIQKKSLLNMQLSILSQKDHLLKITNNLSQTSKENAF